MLNYHHLRYFWAVAREGHLTRAAERLHVSQSALSLQIKQLEEQLGHDLFERRGKRLILTEAGRIALDHADTIFAAGDSLVARLRTGETPLRQTLRVGALATLSRNFQLEFLMPLVGRSDIDLVVRSGTFATLLQSLEAHRLDVVLTNGAPPRDAATPWLPHEIAHQPVSLVGHRDIARNGRSLAELLTEESVVLPVVETGIRTGFDALVDRLGLQLQIAAEIEDMAMLRLVAREHRGLAVVPPIVVKDELEAGVLVEFERLPELKETFFAITLRRRFPNPLLDIVLPRRQGEEV